MIFYNSFQAWLRKLTPSTWIEFHISDDTLLLIAVTANERHGVVVSLDCRDVPFWQGITSTGSIESLDNIRAQQILRAIAQNCFAMGFIPIDATIPANVSVVESWLQ